eukprot:TRINITY_DN8554_c0_g1_i1.p1 TRINITY_DN8554_c0_g1~~TRINITY_DN8554_c0_g1_i1.p1  ORF type:complete len:507 (-),score=82.58 TRINITY_DN8554_c0_g1_i1:834-2354(-)
MASNGANQPPEDLKTLWIGELQPWMDEAYLWNCFAHTGEVQSVKAIRSKNSGQPEGYGFIELSTHAAAERLLATYNGQPMPQSEAVYRMNWASFGINEKRPVAEPGNEHSVFVGDLSNDVNDFQLAETFKQRYPSVRGAKVVVEPETGRSKGYGFVRFGSEEERNRAMTEMNGEYCSNRPMRLSVATPRKPSGHGGMGGGGGAGGGGGPYQPRTPQYNRGSLSPSHHGGGGGGGYGPGNYGGEMEPNNTTIFVGGLDPHVSDDELRQAFSVFGMLTYVKIPYGKGCGFVQFQHRAHAAEALRRMHGQQIGQQTVRLSWGRNPAARRFGGGSGGGGGGGWGGGPPQDHNAWNAQGGYYGGGYGPGYDPYAYGHPQDPNAYAYGPYGGYPGGYPPPMEGQQGDPRAAAAQQMMPPAPYNGGPPPVGGGPADGGGAGRQGSGATANGTAAGGTGKASGSSSTRKEESFDPAIPSSVEKMNAAYTNTYNPAPAHHIWLKPPTFDTSVPAT